MTTVQNMETTGVLLIADRNASIQAVQSALEAAGVEFIPENGGGAGVRLRKGES